MSEFAPQPDPSEALRIHDQELAHIGALVLEAALRDDLVAVAEQHASATGNEAPNTYASPGLQIGAAEIPMKDNSVYRQVHEAAVEDLANSGVVRNPYTAGVKEQSRWKDRVFWNGGEDGKSTQLGNRMVIEADKQAASEGWVTADKVSAVYARDSDGQVKNILPNTPKPEGR